jgi:putative membrane-bound dehydrogenase-like protein
VIRILLFLTLLLPAAQGQKIRTLIVDGRNNHQWQITTDALRATLESTGRFDVSVSTAPELKISGNPRSPNSEDPNLIAAFEKYSTAHKELTKPTKDAFRETWKAWQPDFSNYDVVILNYNGQDWPEATKSSFVDYVKNGGGVFLVHAANNAFGNWKEFNDIIGMGWRPALFGKAIKINPDTDASFWDKVASSSGHGSKHAFGVTVRAPQHPIMQGLPKVWMHGKDELYHDMRGPAENMIILSSAYSDPKQRGTGKHEPITWEVSYGKGRAIVTTMGHFWTGQEDWDGLHCVGFQTIVARSCEYLATGKISLPLPDAFPAPGQTSVQTPSEVVWENQKISDDSKAATRAIEKKKANPYGMLTPEEELTTFDIAPGYIAELVAAEPDVQEPVLTVFDGNGVMYVAEMRSYMQDVEGTDTKTAMNGRIKRLEDTTGDGRMDKVTIFVDGLNLPRAILPLDDRIAVRETDTMDVVSYRDTDGDGVADEKSLLYERGPYGRGNVGTSVEHQDSGLVWNIDNHIYLSYNIERYRFTDGTWRAEKQRGHWTQWGLTHNDSGDLFWMHNSDPVAEPYLHPKYWENVKHLAGKEIHGVPLDMGKPYAPDFMSVKSLCLLNDRGGPAAEVRGFTSAAGQSIFRGHKLPHADYGDYFFCDPTIHVVRRANVSKKDGLNFFEKAEAGDAEFLRSSDINSRFISTATGPDGCLYVTDMYRGIIQDAGWLSPEPRKNIVANGLDKNIQHGRIWRIRHADHTPDACPQMLSETTFQLLRHLEHPNGWWRDTAQKLIILRSDRDTVIPLLEGMSLFSQNALARLHALWTLEGIGTLSLEFVARHYQDRDPRVRRAAIQISERWIDGGETLTALQILTEERDSTVAQQLILTLGMCRSDARAQADDIIQAIARRHMRDRGMILATGVALWGKKDLPFVKEIEASTEAQWKIAFANWNRGLEFPKDMDPDHRRLVRDGEVLYFKSCVACHGADGKGTQAPGTEMYLAPSLTDSPRVKGDPKHLVPILLHGLTGPLDGKTYQAGFMAPGSALGLTRERDIAQVLSYLRYAWDWKGSAITEDEVKAIKQATADRKLPWTQADLEAQN